MGGGDDFSLAVCFGEEDEVGCGCGGGDLNVRRWWVGALEGRSAGLKWKLGHAGLFLFSFSFSFSFLLVISIKFHVASSCYAKKFLSDRVLFSTQC
jgi:hypothetical protein